MSSMQLPPISEAEQVVLRSLWERGPSSVAELQGFLREAGQSWARTTVITLLQRLEAKGYASADKSEYAYRYRAAVTRDELVESRMSDLADDLCDGQWSPLLLAFAKRPRMTPEHVAELQQFVDDLSRRVAGERKKRKKD
jgi:BlaI family transcriptional regulator, penicillinase repressor